MRTASVSLTVIALALAAIVGGFFSGQASSRPFAIATIRAMPSPRVEAVLQGASDAAVVDEFSDDDVVVERPTVDSRTWLPQRLAIVIGLCGESEAIDATFLRLNVPLAFDIDPHAAQAARVASFARAQGDVLLLHVSNAPSAATLTSLRATFGTFDGVASRESAGMAQALAATGLVFFDERGDANPGAFAAAHVALVQRDFTADDRSAPSYIQFMLERAALRSQREGRLVVLMRPLPNSLDALSAFLGTRSADILTLTQSK